VFSTSIIFGVYWILWHVPLSFIKDYYQSNLVELGLWHSISFAVSVIPFVLIMNWLYYKTNRNILVAILFHMSANISNEIFTTHPDNKIIQTGLLLAFSVVLVWNEKRFFFTREFRD
jgi:hypothetical protein